MGLTLIRGSSQILIGSITADRLTSSFNLPTNQLQDGNKIVFTDGTKAMTANLSMGGNVITNHGTPVNATDVVNKAYADAIKSGFKLHFARVVSVTNVNLTGLITVDDVMLSAGDEILLNGQNASSQNGLWIVNSSAWTRPADWAAASTLTEGQYIIVDADGTNYKNTKWFNTNIGSIVVDTTSATFVQDLSGTVYTNGNGINLSGTVFSVKNGNAIGFDGSNAITIIADPNRLLQTIATGVGIKDGTAGQVILANASGNAAYSTISGDVTITSSGATTVTSGIIRYTAIIANETVGGTINGSNTAFTLANIPQVSSLTLALNGVILQPGTGNDYTISGSTITMLFAPLSGDKLTAFYFK